MLNHIVVMGRLTRDPELRYTQSQLPVASFTVAVDRDRAPQGAERETDFIDCVAWRHTAEFVSKYFAKGSMAVVSGRLQLRDWTDRDGGKRRSAEIVADNVYFGEAKRRDDSGAVNAHQSQPNGGYGELYQGDRNYNGGRSMPSGGQYSTAHGAPAQQAAYNPPPQQGTFAELDDDGELPF